MKYLFKILPIFLIEIFIEIIIDSQAASLGIFPIQGLNLDLLHCRQILYQLSHLLCIYYSSQDIEQFLYWRILVALL